MDIFTKAQKAKPHLARHPADLDELSRIVPGFPKLPASADAWRQRLSARPAWSKAHAERASHAP